MPIDPETLYRLIGKRIQSKRTSLGLTQAELADEVDLSRTSIANIEAGNQFAPVHVLYELCSKLGLKPKELFPDLEEMTSNIEIANAIATEVASEGHKKAAQLVRDLARGKEIRRDTNRKK